MSIGSAGPTRWIGVALVVSLTLTGLVACQSRYSSEETDAAALRKVPVSYAPVTQVSSPASTPPISPDPGSASAIVPEAASLNDQQSSTLVAVLPSPSPSSAQMPRTPPPTLQPANLPPVRLVIPSIQLDAPIVPIAWHQASDSAKIAWDDPGSAVGWLKSSALPGRCSNVVLAGHHNIKGEVFRRLVEVRPGDSVYLYGDETTYCYRVAERFIVSEKYASAEQREQNGLWIASTIDERLTLVTCWPYRDNTHRLIVVARPDPHALDASLSSTPCLVSLEQ